MATIQMNTRIDARLKSAGDAALAKAGFSPSQAVRHVWEWAVSHSHEPHVIEKFLNTSNPSCTEESTKLRTRKLALLDDGVDCIHTTLASLNLEKPAKTQALNLSVRKLKELMHEEMLEKNEGA